jgi:hypothetical protein
LHTFFPENTTAASTSPPITAAYALQARESCATRDTFPGAGQEQEQLPLQ